MTECLNRIGLGILEHAGALQVGLSYKKVHKWTIELAGWLLSLKEFDFGD